MNPKSMPTACITVNQPCRASSLAYSPRHLVVPANSLVLSFFHIQLVFARPVLLQSCLSSIPCTSVTCAKVQQYLIAWCVTFLECLAVAARPCLQSGVAIVIWYDSYHRLTAQTMSGTGTGRPPPLPSISEAIPVHAPVAHISGVQMPLPAAPGPRPPAVQRRSMDQPASPLAGRTPIQQPAVGVKAWLPAFQG